MRLKQLIAAAALLCISACAITPDHTRNSPGKSKNVKAPVLIDDMDAQFLYLASQQALSQGQKAMSSRFLSALVKKDPEAVTPRLELVELYLASGQDQQVKEAKRLIESMSDKSIASIKGEAKTNYQILYAKVLIAHDEIDRAFFLLNTQLKRMPENIKIRLLLARLYTLRGDYKLAHKLLKQGIAIKSTLHLQQAMVQLYLQQGETKKADKLLASMQKNYPKHEGIVLQRSQLAEGQKDTLKAEELLKMFIALQGDEAVQSSMALAALYGRQNRLEESIVVYEQLLPLTAGSVDVYMSLGKAYYQVAKYMDAVKVFEQAVAQLKPQEKPSSTSNFEAEALFYLAASLEAAHQRDDAILHYNKLKKKHTLYLDAQLRLVSIDISKKEYGSAESRLRRLMSDFASRIEVYEMLSSLRLQQNKYELLVKETEKALDLGFSQVLLFNRSVALESLKHFEELEASLDSLLNKRPNHAEALNFYGYSLADRGVRLESARKMIMKALTLKPGDGYYLDSLAWVYFKQKKFDKAIEVQLRAIKKVANDAVMQEHLGDMYWQTGTYDKARVMWQKALDLGHKTPMKIKKKLKDGLSNGS